MLERPGAYRGLRGVRQAPGWVNSFEGSSISVPLISTLHGMAPEIEVLAL